MNLKQSMWSKHYHHPCQGNRALLSSENDWAAINWPINLPSVKGFPKLTKDYLSSRWRKRAYFHKHYLQRCWKRSAIWSKWHPSTHTNNGWDYINKEMHPLRVRSVMQQGTRIISGPAHRRSWCHHSRRCFCLPPCHVSSPWDETEGQISVFRQYTSSVLNT